MILRYSAQEFGSVVVLLLLRLPAIREASIN